MAQPDADTMKYLVATAKERHEGYLRQWLANPEFHAALHKKSSCRRCGGDADGRRHACPFQAEVQNDDQFTCGCCPDCERRCRSSV